MGILWGYYGILYSCGNQYYGILYMMGYSIMGYYGLEWIYYGILYKADTRLFLISKQIHANVVEK